MDEAAVRNHDVIVVGASMGGIAALRKVLEALPVDFPAALFIVQHVAEDSPGMLDQVLRRATRLPVLFGADGYPFQRSHVYVARPGYHLVLDDHTMRVLRGPKQNRTRPAVDPLFRSAAIHHGPHVVGVVLTGTLGDGSAGLQAIRRCGGTTVVQDPLEAEFGDMPAQALRAGPVDHCVPLSEMPSLLIRLADEPKNPDATCPADVRQEHGSLFRPAASDGPLQSLPAYVCPECGGAMRFIRDGETPRFLCHTGHSFTAESLLTAQTDEVEHSLWAALRALKERAKLSTSIAAEARLTGAERVADQYDDKAAAAEAHAAVLEKLLTRGPTEEAA